VRLKGFTLVAGNFRDSKVKVRSRIFAGLIGENVMGSSARISRLDRRRLRIHATPRVSGAASRRPGRAVPSPHSTLVR
jgi:hypothetical protein